MPLAVGIGVAGRLNGGAAAFVIAALALFFTRQPLDLALRSWRGKRTRADLPALLIWLAVCGILIGAAGGWLLLRERLWALLPLGIVGGGLLALQLWAGSARLACTLWSEVIGTAGLALAAAGVHYAAIGARTITAPILWALMAIVGVGGVLYSCWRLRRRRLALKAAGDGEGGPSAPPRVSVLSHYGGGAVLTLLLASLDWMPWAVLPLYILLFARVAWGTRPAAQPDRTVLAIGLGEGIATILCGIWIVMAYHL